MSKVIKMSDDIKMQYFHASYFKDLAIANLKQARVEPNRECSLTESGIVNYFKAAHINPYHYIDIYQLYSDGVFVPQSPGKSKAMLDRILQLNLLSRVGRSKIPFPITQNQKLTLAYISLQLANQAYKNGQTNLAIVYYKKSNALSPLGEPYAGRLSRLLIEKANDLYVSDKLTQCAELYRQANQLVPLCEKDRIFYLTLCESLKKQKSLGCDNKRGTSLCLAA